MILEGIIFGIFSLHKLLMNSKVAKTILITKIQKEIIVLNKNKNKIRNLCSLPQNVKAVKVLLHVDFQS